MCACVKEREENGGGEREHNHGVNAHRSTTNALRMALPKLPVSPSVSTMSEIVSHHKGSAKISMPLTEGPEVDWVACGVEHVFRNQTREETKALESRDQRPLGPGKP